MYMTLDYLEMGLFISRFGVAAGRWQRWVFDYRLILGRGIREAFLRDAGGLVRTKLHLFRTAIVLPISALCFLPNPEFKPHVPCVLETRGSGF